MKLLISNDVKRPWIDTSVCCLQSSENSCMLYGSGIKQSTGCDFVLSVVDHRAFILSKYFSYFLNSVSHFPFLTINAADL